MNSKQQISYVVYALDQIGFYAALPASQVDMAKAEAITTGNPLSETTNRLFLVDAETISESGPIEFMQEIMPALHNLGIRIGAIEEIARQGEYSKISIDGIVYGIWDHEQDSEFDPWENPFKNTMVMLADILERARSDNHVYYEYTGNDSFVAIMSEEMRDLLCILPDSSHMLSTFRRSQLKNI